ncbi:MAG TPA: transcription termination factor NusA [Phycisphaerae bacterium]|nr:transcription termination factor NusA [Phycisphaerae bacterium]HRY69290.1 transcription termination factor NusA [Phycisphaerae bacterium]HSA26608.1 transcription termination factor NusA [Phycisphaerae bacterium]
MNAELVRIVDSIARDKNIEKDEVYLDLEQAMESAVRKAYGQLDEVKVSIDRLTGDISAARNGEPIDMRDLGRIAAQTAKQVMIQKIREAERGSIFDEFQDRKGTVVTGTVSRYEGGALIINLGRAEGFLPKSEQIPGETHHPGERIRTLILDVRESPHQVKIVLSRSHPDFIRRLFELEVPEVSERIIEVKALAREAGYRTKIAVSSIDMKVDAVGACVGVRGSRIKNIVVELGGEKIDIVRWNESSQILINNALKPAEVEETALCFELGRATVVVPDDQLSLAIGKRGQNVRLAARLTGWDIDILTPKEYNKGLDDMEKVLSSLEGMTSEKIEKMMAMGIISLGDVEEIGVEPLMKVLGLSEELAQQVISTSSEAAKRLMAEAEAAKAAAAAAAAAESAATSVTEGVETDPGIRLGKAAEEAGAVDGATVPSDAGDGPKPEAPAEPLGTEGVQTPEAGASQQPA